MGWVNRGMIPVPPPMVRRDLPVARTSLLRGGEPFLFPGIIDLLEYLVAKGIATSVDTNGTVLERYAADLVRLGDIGGRGAAQWLSVRREAAVLRKMGLMS
jgi:hypothetical protein